MNRAQVINKLAKKIGAKSYLEIGVQTGKTFRAVSIEKKIGVDPDPQWKDQTHLMTSDMFFDLNTDTFDIIFVDGLHHWETAYRDIMNAVGILNEGGVIIVDDCAPKEEAYQTREPTAIHWTGDVWRAWLRAMQSLDTYWNCCTYDIEFGLGCMYKKAQDDLQPANSVRKVKLDCLSQGNYESFKEHFEDALNFRTPEEFEKDWA